MDWPKFKFYWDKLLALLRVRVVLGGLEISDAVLRLVHFDGRTWNSGAVRLEAGTVEGGRVRNRELLVIALKELKAQMPDDSARKRASVVVALGSTNIYTQVFSLPVVEGENLEKAAELNLQMVSPAEVSQTYSGWQVVGENRDSGRLEILSAFVERSAVDELGEALYEAGFIMVALETRALALTRVFRELGEGVDRAKTYILARVDNSGMDFLIIQQNQLYFEYFNLWRDLADEQGQISAEVFRAAVSKNLRQVLNFYGQRWSEPVSAVFLSASAMNEEVEKIVKEEFALPVIPLLLREGSLGPEWFIALGCFLRGRKPRSSDKELSLLGLTAAEEFRRERFLEFTRFWRLAIPAALSFLLAAIFLSDLYLIQTRRELESRPLFKLDAEQAAENQALQMQAAEFNKVVAIVKAVRGDYSPRGVLIERINDLASASGVSVSKMTFQSADRPVSLSGIAREEGEIAAFKRALEREPTLHNINLPLTGIQSTGEGFSFTVGFYMRL